LDVRVFGQPDFDARVDVDGEGNLSGLPFIETPVRAICRSEKEVQKDIATAYSKYLKSPQVSVRIVGRNSRQPAIVFGAVAAPSRVQMQRAVHLDELIAVSGGITERSNGNIQVFHTQPMMCPDPAEKDNAEVKSSLYKVADLKAGKPEGDPLIRPGDVVTVLEAEPVYVIGSVTSPQPLYLKAGMTLSKALYMVGGVKHEGDAHKVIIHRQNPDSKQSENPVYDFVAIKRNQKEDVPLKPYDVIEVPEAGRLSRGRIIDTVSGMGNNMMNMVPQGLAYHVIY
jgi:protein involved in polysaccharide export with SLBB domain